MAKTRTKAGPRVELLDLDEALGMQAARNPKAHDVPFLVASLSEFGFVELPAVNETTGKFVAGHGRLGALAAMRAEGRPPPGNVVAKGKKWFVPVLRGNRFVDDASAERYLVASNRAVERGGWVQKELAALLAEHARASDDVALALTGYDRREVEALLATVNRPDEPARDAAPTTPPRKPVTKSGDVWTLGRHRVACGDCRSDAVIRRVLGDDRVNVAFTSPPYASQRKYDEASGFKPIPPDRYVEWWGSVQRNVRAAMAPDGSFFVNIKPSAEGLDTSLYVIDLVSAMVRAHGWHFATEFCWERSGVPKSVTQRFKNQFEPVYQFTLDRWKMRPRAVMHHSDSVPVPGGQGVGDTSWGNARAGVGGDAVLPNAAAPGMAYPGNRLPTFGAGPATGHTATFPVGLPTFFVLAFSDPDDVVLDPFVGSGTTIVACENEGRAGRGVEISPGYVDVVVERWQNLTGGKATRRKR